MPPLIAIKSVSSFYWLNIAFKFSLFVAGRKIKYGLYFRLQVLRCALFYCWFNFPPFRSANIVAKLRAAHLKKKGFVECQHQVRWRVFKRQMTIRVEIYWFQFGFQSAPSMNKLMGKVVRFYKGIFVNNQSEGTIKGKFSCRK